MNKTPQVNVEPDHSMKLLESGDGATRERARESLLTLGKDAVSPLMESLENSPITQMRWEAAKALGALNDNKSIPALVKALEDSDSDVAWLAAEALRQFNRRAWAPILRALINSEGKSGSLRRGAHQVLAHRKALGFQDVFAALIASLQPGAAPGSTVLAAQEVLSRMKAST